MQTSWGYLISSLWMGCVISEQLSDLSEPCLHGENAPVIAKTVFGGWAGDSEPAIASTNRASFPSTVGGGEVNVVELVSGVTEAACLACEWEGHPLISGAVSCL